MDLISNFASKLEPYLKGKSMKGAAAAKLIQDTIFIFPGLLEESLLDIRNVRSL
ncbi:hypothetical protein FB446DRAFT_745109 [Lentinula raphanica]|nr:hypothetical protein FB446DRAFT_745109 [Lentinula raphanica]